MNKFIKLIGEMSARELTEYLKKAGIKFEKSKYPQSVVAFDLDEVIINFVDAWKELYAELYGVTPVLKNEDINNHLDKIYGLPADKSFHVVDLLVEAKNLHRIKFMEGAIDILNKHFENRPLIIITHRDKTEQKPLEEYLHDHLTKISEIHVFRTYNSTDRKLFYLNKCGVYFFVDDKLKTCKYLFEESRGGIQPILYGDMKNYKIGQEWVKIMEETKVYSHIESVVYNWNDIDKLLYNIFGKGD